MTKSTITRERAQQIFLGNGPEPSASEERELARMALAAMDSEPVAWTDEEELRDVRRVGFGEMFSVEPITPDADMCRVIPLYRHAQPAPVVPAEPDKELTDDVLDGIIAGATTSMEQYLALSLKAEREAWRQGEPTDDERIMAIEGIIPGLDEHVRYESNAGGNLWIQCSRHKFEKMKQAGMLTRMLYERPEAGNSPVIPDGLKLVPIDATRSMIDAAMRVEEDGYDAMHKAMLAAAPQEVNHG